MHSRSRLLLVAAAALLPAGPALVPSAATAAPARHASGHGSDHASRKPAAAPAGPKELGHFNDWTAATYEQGGKTACYAFTRAHPVGSAAADAAPLLTVTERAGSRDEVAIANPAAYPKGAEVQLQVDQNGVDLYTFGRNAFARDPKAALSAFQHGSQATLRQPDGHGGQSTDKFSLMGFSAAYGAITKACPGH